eukprot:1158604-Pelagomonas_calceolata.AAC.11
MPYASDWTARCGSHTRPNACIFLCTSFVCIKGVCLDSSSFDAPIDAGGFDALFDAAASIEPSADHLAAAEAAIVAKAASQPAAEEQAVLAEVPSAAEQVGSCPALGLRAFGLTGNEMPLRGLLDAQRGWKMSRWLAPPV